MKTLIFLENDKLAPIGGPLGVGYNIREELKKREITNIDFLHGDNKVVSKGKVAQLLRWLKSYARMFFFLEKQNKPLFDNYDIIHFHSVKHLYKERKALEGYRGVVLLTSHSPVPMAMEMHADITNKFPMLNSKWLLGQLRKIDYYAFNRADYIMFPCPEAEEPYFNNWDDYALIKNKKKDNYRYCLTGIVPAKAQEPKESIRTNYDINQDKFVVSYVGRHNEVKGYDTLKIMGEQYLCKYPEDYFLICGKEFPLTGLSNSHWIEIGWTKKAHAFVNAADVFVLPNKETYFDLVMLEVLSLGKIVVASRTGGNKFFERKGVKGIFLYESIDEALAILSRIRSMSSEERSRFEKANQNFFYEELTIQRYVDNYLNLLNDVWEKK